MKVTTAKYYIPSGRCIQAINYAEKNPDGSVKKIADSLKMPFKTKAGRVVYDGGGIDPDLKTKKDFLAPIVFYLMAKGITADFANQYVAKNTKPASAKSFRLPDAEYEKFIQFAKAKNFTYESGVDSELKSLKEKAEDEKLMPSIQKAYEELAAKLKEAKANEFLTHKKDIHEYLEGEIIKRYFFRKGVVEHDFDHDEDIKECLKLFANPTEYNKLLKK